MLDFGEVKTSFCSITNKCHFKDLFSNWALFCLNTNDNTNDIIIVLLQPSELLVWIVGALLVWQLSDHFLACYDICFFCIEHVAQKGAIIDL